ncbi:MAG: hypothetical protein Q7U54_21830 [Bacteroidales bacterium]|nr:hypothetical protein [Bacteroidales bacterium]
MIHHENDLNPGPLTVTGFKGGSCDQAIYPGNNRTLFKPTAKGQHWLWVQPGYGFKFRTQAMSGNTSGVKFKNELLAFAGIQEIMNLFPENTRYRLDYFPVTTEFPIESNWLATRLKKTGTIATNAVICRFKLWDGGKCIYHGKTSKSAYIAGKYPSGFFRLKMPDSNKLDKTPILRRKTNQPNWLDKLLKWQVYPAEFDLKLCNKLGNN